MSEIEDQLGETADQGSKRANLGDRKTARGRLHKNFKPKPQPTWKKQIRALNAKRKP